MKNLIIYYLLVFVPIIPIVLLFKNDIIEFTPFIILFLVYAFIYRTIIDYYRLLSKNRINKGAYWKLLIPGARIKYFYDLYLP